MLTSATIEIFGYVGQDPRSPNSASPNFVTFSVSVNRRDKKKEKVTTWYECQTSNEKVAEVIRSQIRKGVFTRVRGSFSMGTYQDKTGKTVTTCKVYINSIFDIIPFVANANKNETVNDVMYPRMDDDIDLDDSIPF